MKKILLLVTLIGLSTIAAKAQVPTLNLEAQYYFTGNANDNSGHGNNGVAFGAVLTQDRFGISNCAYNFSPGSYIDCNNVLNTTIAGVGKQMTISFWVKPSGNNLNSFIISKHADAGCGSDERQFLIRALNNVVNVEYYGTLTGTVGRFVCGNTVMSDTSKWYFVTVQYDGTINTNNGLDRVKIFVDNTPETTSLACRSQIGTFPFNIPTGPADFAIGNYVNSSGTPCQSSTVYNGKIDDIRIYSRLLTTNEITSIYTESPVGVETLENPIGMNIYPNPASGYVTVSLKGLPQKSEIKVENMLGQIVYSQTISGAENTTQIRTDSYTKGIYSISITSENQVLTNQKLVIE